MFNVAVVVTVAVAVNVTTKCKYWKWFRSAVKVIDALLRNMVINTNSCNSYKRDPVARDAYHDGSPRHGPPDGPGSASIPSSAYQQAQASHHYQTHYLYSPQQLPPEYREHIRERERERERDRDRDDYRESRPQSHHYSEEEYYHHRSNYSQGRFLPETYNDSWYVKEGVNRVNRTDTNKRSTESYEGWSNDKKSTNVMDVYDDDTRTNLRANLNSERNYRAVVVNVNGDSSVVPPTEETTETKSYGWCISGGGGAGGNSTPTTTTNTETSWIPWCRPAVFLLVLVLLVLVFVLISGILLYFNCTYM